MKNILREKSKKIPNNFWIILAIILVGVFLRTYQFHDYLRFNPDQSRDAALIRDVANLKQPLPLLGPKAGGTEFRLGPAFYYFQFLSAKIFGANPSKMAYPDLLFSLLSIPLLYLLLRKYFNLNISLIVSALFSVSFFAVKYARFAWNPNSALFFVLLFLLSLIEIASSDQKRKLMWAVILGIAMGIGIQLHSLLLFAFPISSIIYFVHFYLRKIPVVRLALIVIFVASLLNLPEIVGEVQGHGKNIQAFFKGMEKKSERGDSVWEKLKLDAVCHIQANSFIVSSVGSEDNCDFLEADKFKNPALSGRIILSLFFSLGSYALLIYRLKKEKDPRKKNFLSIVTVYISVMFLILIPLALEISMRFFLVLEFVPFVFLGLWLEFLGERWGKRGMIAGALLILILVALNLYTIRNKFDYLAGQNNNLDFTEITLGEVEFMANFITSRDGETKQAYLEGRSGELFKITKSVDYFTSLENIKTSEYKKDQPLAANDKLFFIDISSDSKEKNIGEKYDILSQDKLRRAGIFEIRSK